MSEKPFVWHGTWDQFNEQVRDAWNGREGKPVIAHIGTDEPELSDAAETILRDNVQLRRMVAEILAVFLPSGSGHTARVGQVQIRKWRERAGLETQA